MSKVIKEISKYLSMYESVEKVLLFGSRARGDNKERSDIDIAIFGEVKEEDCAKISFYFQEEVSTLLKIDCVYTCMLDKKGKFFENIIKEGVVIYERK